MFGVTAQPEFAIFGIVCIAAAVLIVVVGVLTLRYRSRMQARQFQSERAFLAAWNAVSDEVRLLLDTKTQVVRFVSGDVFTVLGMSAEDLKGDAKALGYCIDRADSRELNRLFQTWDGESILDGECSFTPLGSTTQHFGRLTVKPAGEGLAMVVLRDISSEKRLRDRLERERDEAVAHEREKSDFLSSTSHEIRTPLNGVMGLLALAKETAKGNLETRIYLEQAEDLSKYLLTLINDILDMSKIESGKMELEERPFDLVDVMLQEDEIFRNMIEEKGITFTVANDDLPERYVVGDQLRVVQVLTNLLSNAYKFTDEGGQISCILRHVQSFEGTEHVMFEVSDTGKGMAPEFLDRIFKPFVQEDTSISRRFGGSGLGMSITDNMVRLMGGQIVVESEVGKGSTFRIYLGLPVASDAQVLEAKERHDNLMKSSNVEPEPFHIDGCRILLAEDNKVNSMMADRMLTGMGARIDVAFDGFEALQKFEESEPGTYGLILMDVQMPRMDGRDATPHIRALDRPDAATVPILALSANAFVEDIRESKAAGMNGHLAKPIEYSELEKAIARELV